MQVTLASMAALAIVTAVAVAPQPVGLALASLALLAVAVRRLIGGTEPEGHSRPTGLTDDDSSLHGGNDAAFVLAQSRQPHCRGATHVPAATR